MNVSTDTEELARPLRADARRNRERILKAARAVFSAHGRDAHLEDVARRAEVGVGTVYRHFPTKAELLEALAREQFDLLTQWAQAAELEADPWAAFHTMICNRLEVICHEDLDTLAAPHVVPFVAAAVAQSKERYGKSIGEARLMIGNAMMFKMSNFRF